MQKLKWICSRCKKRFKTEQGANDHIKAYHHKKGGEALPYEKPQIAYDDSMADLFVEAEINRQIGEQNPEWLEDMMP